MKPRTDELQDIFDRLGKGASYGASTTHCAYCGEPLPARRRLGRHECPEEVWSDWYDFDGSGKRPGAGMIVHGRGVFRQLEARAKQAWEKARKA